ncbi:MAG TPA: efflux RND transporter periplasmic adaptor subunit [Candidatus Acidoferrales bacterium]|nr:efflux RND transporter periplasmic adaptor subunit [Candidatus Acidoferrales bacterium]
MTENAEYSSHDAGKFPKGQDRTRRGHGILVAAIVFLIVAAVVVAGIVPRLKARAELRAETYALAIPNVSVMHPKLGEPKMEVVLPGNMQAFIDSPIYARTNGYLKSWQVDIGARVKSGQLLAEIETPEVDQQLDQARADLNTARANAHLSEITATRYKDLLKTDSVSQQDVDNAVGDNEAKKAMVSSAESNVRRLEQLQSFEKIYAPFDGVITARNTDIGHLIDSGASGGAATELFHIAAIKKLRVYVNVPQSESVGVHVGLSAELTLPQFPGRQFQGALVRTADAIDPATRTLLIEVDVNNPSGELLPGAYAEVHLKIPSATPTFILPVNTLIFRTAGMQVATVVSGNKAAMIPIVLGRDFGSEVEVVSGLKEDDMVIENPPDSLVDGEQVRVVAPETQQP